MAFPAAAALAAGASIVSGVVNSARQAAANKQNIDFQNYWNERQLDFARNAHSIAAADKMRAGLSPLETSPANAQALTSPQVQASEFPDLGNAISQGMSADINTERLRNETKLTNAQAANIDADTASKVADAQYKVGSLQDRLDAMREEAKQKKWKTSQEKEEWNMRMEELEERIRYISAQTTNLLHDTANAMSMNPRLQEESISRANLNNSQAAKNRIETHGAFVEVRQKLNDLVKSERWNIRSSDKLPSILLSLIAGEDRFVHGDAALVKATVEAAQNYAKFNKMSDTQFIDYLLSELETVLTYSH